MNRLTLALGVWLTSILLIAGCADDGNGGDDLGLDDTGSNGSSLEGGGDDDADDTGGAATLTPTATLDDDDDDDDANGDDADDDDADDDGAATGGRLEVEIDDDSIDDQQVPVGTTVVWVNDDDEVHFLTSEDGTIDSGEIAPGATFEHTFAEAGTYTLLLDDGASTAEVTVGSS